MKKSRSMYKNALTCGGYSLIVTVIVLVILIVVNIFASAMPATWTQQDMSSTQLFSVGSNTKSIVQNLQQDVTVYWLVQNDAEYDVLENLLSKFEGLSEHLEVVKRNPDVYPTFAQQYTDETVQNNSLIVTCGDRSRYVSFDEIYVTEIDYSTYSYVYTFNGEGAITAAIDYVTNENLPKVYILEGHGEADLPTILTEQLQDENIETDTLSLLTLEAVPEDADAVFVYAPQSDISEDEKNKLSAYVTGGGKLLVLAGPVEEGSLPNLNSLLSDYGITVSEGIVVEEDRDHYFYGYPLILLPEVVTETVWSYGETEVEIDDIQSAIEALSATDFTREEPTGQVEIRILLSMSSDYADTMEIVLYRQDGSTCLCEVNGEIQCLVSRSEVVDLMEAVNEIILN